MSFPINFNWVLKINPPPQLRAGETYSFSKLGNRVFPLNTPIDLISEQREAIAKIKVTEFTNDGEKTIGFYTVLKIYESPEKEVLSNYWKENA